MLALAAPRMLLLQLVRLPGHALLGSKGLGATDRRLQLAEARRSEGAQGFRFRLFPFKVLKFTPRIGRVVMGNVTVILRPSSSWQDSLYDYGPKALRESMLCRWTLVRTAWNDMNLANIRSSNDAEANLRVLPSRLESTAVKIHVRHSESAFHVWSLRKHMCLTTGPEFRDMRDRVTCGIEFWSFIYRGPSCRRTLRSGALRTVQTGRCKCRSPRGQTR